MQARDTSETFLFGIFITGTTAAAVFSKYIKKKNAQNKRNKC